MMIDKNVFYLSPLWQSLVVNSLNQEGVIEVVNLVSFKTDDEKLKSFKTASYLHNIGHWPSRVLGDVVEHLRLRFKDSLHLLSLENLFVADIVTMFDTIFAQS